MAKDRLTDTIKLLVIGGSAGSLEVIFNILPDVEPDISFAVVLVLHRRGGTPSQLPELLAARTRLPVKEADEKEPIRPAFIYLAPPDYHLLVEKDHTFSLDYSEKVQCSRPSIDVTFETAAEAYGSSLACLLLSGASADGTNGLKRVSELGGLTMVQDPATAEVSYMPQYALDHLPIDYVLTVDAMKDLIRDFDIPG